MIKKCRNMEEKDIRKLDIQFKNDLEVSFRSQIYPKTINLWSKGNKTKHIIFFLEIEYYLRL